MRKIIVVVGIWLVMVVGFLVTSTTSVNACANWCPDATCIYENIDGSCASWAHSCCDSGSGQIRGCYAGSYACNNNSGCCAVGTGTPGKGGGESEGGCEMETYQEYTCRETKQVCWQSCFFNKRGEEKCYKECEGGGEECSFVNRQRCRVDAPPPCVPSCGAPSCGQADGCGGTCATWDYNNWGAWGACSVTCGGGIQLSYSVCGSTRWQACNTQSCQGPWWQVKDGDVTATGDIVSKMPGGLYFDTVGSGGFPGVPVYRDQIAVTPGTISSTLWSANTTTSLPRIFNYSYFDNLIPDDTVINDISKLTTGVGVTLDANGYEWYKITGNIDTAGNIDFGSRKVILFVKTGNFNINGKINLNDNSGFFGVFVNGNISVAGTVTGSPSIEGMYIADTGFSTGLGTSQLNVRGSVASYGGITLQRDLPDDTVTPAELFEFAPDQVMLFPQKLMYKRTKWAEVAP